MITCFKLLEHEVLVSDQVKMLMEMDEANKALDKAIDSGDAQLGTLYPKNQSVLLINSKQCMKCWKKCKNRRTLLNFFRPLFTSLLLLLCTKRYNDLLVIILIKMYTYNYHSILRRLIEKA